MPGANHYPVSALPWQMKALYSFIRRHVLETEYIVFSLEVHAVWVLDTNVPHVLIVVHAQSRAEGTKTTLSREKYNMNEVLPRNAGAYNISTIQCGNYNMRPILSMINTTIADEFGTKN